MSVKDKVTGLTRRDFVKSVGVGIGAVQLAACGVNPGPQPAPQPAQIVSWPIAKKVYTTAQQQSSPWR